MKLQVQFQQLTPNFSVTFEQTSCDMGLVFEEVQTVTEYVGGEVYEGEYTITPKVLEQKAYTAGKVLTDDITVFAIPYYDVSNASGGSTVYIGNEV